MTLADDPVARHYGYELTKVTGLMSGTLYPILARLEDAGWVEANWEEVAPGVVGRPRRRYYRLSAAGARVVQDAAALRQHSLLATRFRTRLA